jgi:hypothetical protein
MKLIFLYSPDAIREMTSRLVIFRVDDSLATAAAVVDHHDEILHAGDPTPSRAPETTRVVFRKIRN